jgi:hypothetical protein
LVSALPFALPAFLSSRMADFGLRRPKHGFPVTDGLAALAARGIVRGEPQMRLTVRIRKNDSRLHRYATWRAS